MNAQRKDLRLVFDQRAEDFSPQEWNSLLVDSFPLMRWEWFAALESSGSLEENAGFRPAHLAVYRGPKLVALAPLYWKYGLRAEWTVGGALAQYVREEDFAPQRRLIGIIPFTPVPGYRLLIRPGENQPVIQEFIFRHLQSLVEEEETLLQFQHVSPHRLNLLPRVREGKWLREPSHTFRWFNRSYQKFEDYLASFSSKRRNKIRREIKNCRAEGVEFVSYKGEDISRTLMRDMYDAYLANNQKHYGDDGYLTWEFWDFIAREFNTFLHILVARHRGKTVGLNLMVESEKALYGRWWGALDESIPFLHFNACYYEPIAYAIETKKEYMDPGFQGKFKRWRGFESHDVVSYIYTDRELVRQFLMFSLHLYRDEEL